MRRLIVPVLLVLLTACGDEDPAPVAALEATPAAAPETAPAGAPEVEGTVPDDGDPALVGDLELVPTFDAPVAYNETCAGCHGETGAGDGVAGAALDPKPTDFTDPAYHAGVDDDYLVKVITEGGASVGKSPLMAAFGGVYEGLQISQIVLHLRSFNPRAEADGDQWAEGDEPGDDPPPLGEAPPTDNPPPVGEVRTNGTLAPVGLAEGDPPPLGHAPPTDNPPLYGSPPDGDVEPPPLGHAPPADGSAPSTDAPGSLPEEGGGSPPDDGQPLGDAPLGEAPPTE